MATDTLQKIKLALRTSHDKLDEDIQADIDACLADLELCGVVHASAENPLIYNAIKLWCRSLYTDDPAKEKAFLMTFTACSPKRAEASGICAERWIW